MKNAIFIRFEIIDVYKMHESRKIFSWTYLIDST